MKKFIVIIGVFLGLNANAKADICYDIDKKAANKAVEIIKTQKEIYKYCSICPDAEPETIIVRTVQDKGPVYVNDAVVDVAHAYYKKDNKFINLGVASGCIKAGEYDIKAELDDLRTIHLTHKDNDEPTKKNLACENLTFPALKEDKPLLTLFSDIEVAEMTNTCFKQKIKDSATQKQFESYERVYENLKIVLQAILFYKGTPFEQKIALYEMLYMFQTYFFAKLTNDRAYEFPLSYQYHEPSKHWNKKRILEQEILQISNIEARRGELYNLFLAAEDVTNFFYHSGIHDINILKEKEKDFINIVYNMVMKIKYDKYFMNPNNSEQFFNDCMIWEMMTGKTTRGSGTKKLSCPLPFP